MRALALLDDARRQGITILPDGGDLIIRGRFDDGFLAELRTHKAEILAALTAGDPPADPANQNRRPAPEWTPEDWLHFYGERAGIIEFDGGEDRTRAEFEAFGCCLARWQELHPGTTRHAAAQALVTLGLPPAPEGRQ